MLFVLNVSQVIGNKADFISVSEVHNAATLTLQIGILGAAAISNDSFIFSFIHNCQADLQVTRRALEHPQIPLFAVRDSQITQCDLRIVLQDLCYKDPTRQSSRSQNDSIYPTVPLVVNACIPFVILKHLYLSKL